MITFNTPFQTDLLDTHSFKLRMEHDIFDANWRDLSKDSLGHVGINLDGYYTSVSLPARDYITGNTEKDILIELTIAIEHVVSTYNQIDSSMSHTQIAELPFFPKPIDFTGKPLSKKIGTATSGYIGLFQITSINNIVLASQTDGTISFSCEAKGESYNMSTEKITPFTFTVSEAKLPFEVKFTTEMSLFPTLSKSELASEIEAYFEHVYGTDLKPKIVDLSHSESDSMTLAFTIS